MWAVRSQYKKSDWYDAVRWDPTRDNLINMKDDEQHATLRSKMAAGVSTRYTLDLVSRLVTADCEDPIPLSTVLIVSLLSCSTPEKKTRTWRVP